MTNKAQELLKSIEGPLSPAQFDELTDAMLSDLKSSIEDVRAEFGDEAAQEYTEELPELVSQCIRDWIAKNEPAGSSGYVN
jgi:hypothetical protein